MYQNLVQRMKNHFEDTQFISIAFQEEFQYAFSANTGYKNHVQEKTTSVFYLRAVLQS